MLFVESHQIHFYDEDNGNSESRKASVQLDSGFSSVVNDDEFYSSIVASLYYVILKCSGHSKSLVNFIIALINRYVSVQSIYLRHLSSLGLVALHREMFT